MGAALAEAVAFDFAQAWDEIDQRLGKWPHFRQQLEERVNRVASTKSIQAAAKWLAQFEHRYFRLSCQFLTVDSGDESIKNAAKDMAMHCERTLLAELGSIKGQGRDGEYVMGEAARLVRDLCQGAGVDVPTCVADALTEDGEPTETEKRKIAAEAMRLCSDRWWRRQLRKVQARKLEHVNRVLGRVSKKTGIYCSNATLFRRRQQQARNRELLESMEAENDAGQVFTLAELSDRGVSNPVNRCNELLTRVRGFEEWAEQDGGNWAPMFYTLTAPSRFHSHDRGGRAYKAWERAGMPDPRQAIEWLNTVWQRVRAAWQRAKIQFFGLRVAEPHHDGCPHFHILVWLPGHQEARASELFWYYAIGADGDLPPEEKTLKRRIKIDRINPESGTPTGYVCKYITKNVHGAKFNGEEFETGAVLTALRVEAWASTWGIRQFQQIGGASVTVWRELRRLGDTEIADAAELDGLREAANGGDWSGYTERMGGAVLPRAERPLRAFMVRKRDDADALVRNFYGEFVRQIKGLMAWGWLPVTTRLYEWTVQPVKRAAQAANEAAQPPPWTCVNNCTG